MSFEYMVMFSWVDFGVEKMSAGRARGENKTDEAKVNSDGTEVQRTHVERYQNCDSSMVSVWVFPLRTV